MYAIRVQVEEGRLDVRASGLVAPEEALRAVSQAFVLAEAGGITRATCDLTAVEGGGSSIVVLGAAFASRVQPSQRVAVLCTKRQIAFCRRLARLSGFGDNLGLFTREQDAVAWLGSVRRPQGISGTARRHFSTGTAPRSERTQRDATRAAS